MTVQCAAGTEVRQDVLAHVGRLLGEIKPVYAGGESIRADALLGADLALTSLDVVRLAALLQRKYGEGRPLPFQKLLVAESGAALGDLSVGRIVDFICRQRGLV